MINKAQHAGVDFRPHFKTHQSQAIGRWFRELGVEKIAVSSMQMADYFAHDQWQDIMVAFPVNVREMKAINRLASTINLGILLADPHVLDSLSDGLTQKVDFYVKIDVGTHRTGIDAEDIAGIEQLVEKATHNPNLRFKGFVAHAGHTYQTNSLNDVHKVFRKGSKLLAGITRHFKSRFPDIIASWGDTPTCSLESEFPGIDEIRPGNFVFYDLMQYHLASCDQDQIAMVVAAPVVAKHKERNEIVIYGGAVHLSKDYIILNDTDKVYGEVVRFNEKGWESFSNPIYVNRLSQEHGIFNCPDEHWEVFKPGDLLGIIPVHSCLTADLLKTYYNIREAKFL